MKDLLDALMKDAFDFLKNVSDKARSVAEKTTDAQTNSILAYPLQAKGHMLRPFLVYMTSLAINGERHPDDKEELVTFGAAVELLHNASLIHDDLIDGSETRRGKPSLYKKYGPQNAILAGNCYYIRALQLSNTALTPALTGEILDTAFVMCAGELLQAQYGSMTMPDEVYTEVIRAKTAALAALSCKGAAMLCRSPRPDLWAQVGEKIGLIYQLKDDAKDKDAPIRATFDYDDAIAILTRQIEELLAQTGCTDGSRKFTDLIRLF